jgi:hypothetical protein
VDEGLHYSSNLTGHFTRVAQHHTLYERDASIRGREMKREDERWQLDKGEGMIK